MIKKHKQPAKVPRTKKYNTIQQELVGDNGDFAPTPPMDFNAIMALKKASGSGYTKDEEGLNWKQRRFVEEYLASGSAQSAFKEAGYKCDGVVKKRNMTSRVAWLIKKPHVKQAIEKRQSLWRDKMEVTQERVLKEYACIAFANLSDYYTIDPNTGEINVIPKEKLSLEQQVAIADITIFENVVTNTRKISKIKLHDKVRALESLAKHLGLFSEHNKQKSNINIHLDDLMAGLPKNMQDQVKQRLASDIMAEDIDKERVIN